MPAEILPLYPVNQAVTLLAPAKVNLFIDVLDRRPDGYHNLDAVNVSVSLFDEIELLINESGTFELSCNWDHIPSDNTNHLLKAAAMLLEGTRYGVSIRLHKRIPVGAGLGGGTADAGVLLRYLGKFLQASERSLMQKALLVGSDVPFCLHGGPARVRGRGEWVAPLKGVPRLRLALLDPGGNHETRSVYARMVPSERRAHPPAEDFILAWRKADWNLMGSRMFNAFQEVVFSQRPELDTFCQILLDRGCAGVCLTGTGSHLVGLLPEDSPPVGSWGLDSTEFRVQEVATLETDFKGWIQRH